MSFTLLERGKSEKLRLNKEEFASTASLLVSSSIDPIIHSVGSTSRLCSNEICNFWCNHDTRCLKHRLFVENISSGDPNIY